jgi:hypothetical protein
MAQDLTNKFEKKKSLSDSDSSNEKVSLEIEKGDSIIENLPEKESSNIEKSGEEIKSLEKNGESAKPVIKKTKLSIASPDIERQKQIDQILSEGLDEVFLSLSQADQARFKEEGDKTVLKINELLSQTKIKIKKIINLIKNWLKIIPKVNRHFLEQEAKIKADKIIKLKK